jgi:hypothetical protein
MCHEVICRKQKHLAAKDAEKHAGSDMEKAKYTSRRVDYRGDRLTANVRT